MEEEDREQMIDMMILFMEQAELELLAEPEVPDHKTITEVRTKQTKITAWMGVEEKKVTRAEKTVTVEDMRRPKKQMKLTNWFTSSSQGQTEVEVTVDTKQMNDGEQ